jgi:hypothetical protein
VKRFSLRFAGLLAGLVGMVMMAAAPAGALTVGGGAVTGTVTISGITLTAQATNYTFRPIQLAGAIADSNGSACAGLITTSVVTGGSASEDLNGGSGTVNPFTFSGSNAACSVNGSTNGTGAFSRTGPLVTVTINATLTICTAVLGCHTSTANITVVALFLPTSGNGVTAPVTQAAFVGVFVVGVPQ